FEKLFVTGEADVVAELYSRNRELAPGADKLLIIEVFEKNGGRNQTFTVENADLIPIPQHRRPWNNYISLTGARENNCKLVLFESCMYTTLLLDLYIHGIIPE
ncbi:hypothetical protein, partial [Bacteroides sp. 519]|uniref:hypothetical protein n=1 Tax=Bacteroides sp. 519 TaxID=2302937 RepID=UPI0013CF995C